LYGFDFCFFVFIYKVIFKINILYFNYLSWLLQKQQTSSWGDLVFKLVISLVFSLTLEMHFELMFGSQEVTDIKLGKQIYCMVNEENVPVY